MKLVVNGPLFRYLSAARGFSVVVSIRLAHMRPAFNMPGAFSVLCVYVYGFAFVVAPVGVHRAAGERSRAQVSWAQPRRCLQYQCSTVSASRRSL